MANENKIYREKSLEQLSEPEQLNEYVRVASPGVWFLLSGIILLLIGLIIWGIFGKITTTVIAPAEVSDGKITCYLLAEDVDKADDPLIITIGDVETEAFRDSAETITLDASYDSELFESKYLSRGKTVTAYTCDTTLKDGYYEAEVTTETLNPISLLFSKD